jgi:3-phosphoshikimate 1-carboxyvinyltransferase
MSEGALNVAPAHSVSGEVRPGGDKSISHRALILGALARGRSYLNDLSPADDVRRTADCLSACGASIRILDDSRVALDGAGPGWSLYSPKGKLDCGNSGSTARMLAGVFAGHEMTAVLDGDRSLRGRPMRRVAAPLREMGAMVRTTKDGLPMTIEGRMPLHAIDHVSEVASAQVKTAVLLAGLSADGPTSVTEPMVSRDHTERMLRMCGVNAAVDGTRVTVHPGGLEPFGLRVPQDLSSAAFFLCLAAAREGWTVRAPGVSLNPGRTGVLEVLRSMGAHVEIEELEPAGGVEPIGDVTVRGGPLRSVMVGGTLIPRCIDEIPVLAVLATQAEGTTVIRDAAELRVKESDRIGSLAEGLRAMGATVDISPDGMAIEGPVALKPANVNAVGDHRLAMAFAVAGCLAFGTGTSRIGGAEAVAVSYPQFAEDLVRLTS